MAGSRLLFVLWLTILSEGQGNPTDNCLDIPGSNCELGSRVLFHTSSASIQPLLSRSLSLRCALHDTAASATIIGRSVSSTADNAKFITSIFISRDGADIATVSEHVPARPLFDLSNIRVSGGIPGQASGERAFLQVNWTFPDSTQGGNYSCSIAAIDEVGHQVTYTSSVDVDVTEPSISDLVRHIHDQDMKIYTLDQQIVTLNTEKLIMSDRIDHLETKLNESQHVEQGVVFCGRLGYDGQYPQSTTKYVTFKEAYKSVPLVYLAVLDVDFNKDVHGNFDVKLTTADTRSFSVTCDTESASYRVHNLRVSWLSLP